MNEFYLGNDNAIKFLIALWSSDGYNNATLIILIALHEGNNFKYAIYI